MLKAHASEAKRVMRARNTTGSSGPFLDMDHRKLLDTFASEVQGRVVRSAVGAASTVVRKQAKKNINKVGPSAVQAAFDAKGRKYNRLVPQSKIGRSQKTGTWDSVRNSDKTKRLARRAAALPKKRDKNGQLYAEFGPKIGALGKSGLSDWMMTRYHRYNNTKSTVGITGPAWRVAAQGHVLEFGSKHRAWGKPSSPLPPRPFLRPAAQQTRKSQQSKIISTMKKWQKRV